MIRINLLAAERPTQKKRKAAAAGPPGALQAYILLGGALALALLVCAALWLAKSRAIADLDSKIGAAKARQAQLQVIKQQVEVFERKKALLDAKVQLIERLKAQQSGPVHMLDEVSKALPDLVWLTSVEQTGMTLKLAGEANGLTAVADFISNLQRSGWFPNVELLESTEADRIYKFTLSAEFKPQEPPSAAAPTAAAGGIAGGAPAAGAARP